MSTSNPVEKQTSSSLGIAVRFCRASLGFGLWLLKGDLWEAWRRGSKIARASWAIANGRNVIIPLASFEEEGRSGLKKIRPFQWAVQRAGLGERVGFVAARLGLSLDEFDDVFMIRQRPTALQLAKFCSFVGIAPGKLFSDQEKGDYGVFDRDCPWFVSAVAASVILCKGKGQDERGYPVDLLSSVNVSRDSEDFLKTIAIRGAENTRSGVPSFGDILSMLQDMHDYAGSNHTVRNSSRMAEIIVSIRDEIRLAEALLPAIPDKEIMYKETYKAAHVSGIREPFRTFPFVATQGPHGIAPRFSMERRSLTLEFPASDDTDKRSDNVQALDHWSVAMKGWFDDFKLMVAYDYVRKTVPTLAVSVDEVMARTYAQMAIKNGALRVL